MRTAEKENVENVLALTPMQAEMLFYYRKEPNSRHYYEQLNLEINGRIEPQYFEKAWNCVISTNQMLRTLFRWEKISSPMQVVLKKHTITPTYYQLSQQENQLEELLQADREKSFDLREVPFRVTLCQTGERTYHMLISNHHIIYDGWSNGLIISEFFAAYNHLVKGNEITPTLKTPFQEYVKWLQSRDESKQARYWKNNLRLQERTRLAPVGNKTVKTHTTGEYKTTIPLHMETQLELFTKEHKITMAALLYCAWGILLQKYTYSDNSIFGTTVSGRSAKVKGIEKMVGLFINTLPLSLQTQPREKVLDSLTRINRTVQAREEFESTSLTEIKQYVSGVEELFDTLVVIENYPLEAIKLSNTADSAKEIRPTGTFAVHETAHYDITAAITRYNGIEIKLIYDKSLFDEEAVARLAAHYTYLLCRLGENPGQQVEDIELLSEEEKKKIRLEFNQTGAGYSTDKAIHELIEAQVERSPDSIALLDIVPPERNNTAVQHAALTYRELDKKSNYLAQRLREQGVQPGTIVALSGKRAAGMLVGILAILKTGGVYLPIDPNTPPQRTRYIMADSNAKYMLTTRDEPDNPLDKRNPDEKKPAEENPDERNDKTNVAGNGKESNDDPDRQNEITSYKIIDIRKAVSLKPGGDSNASENQALTANRKQERNEVPHDTRHPATRAAYIIYTSGTTGSPKGVPTAHANLSPLLHWARGYLGLGTKDRLLQNMSYHFDFSVLELFT
ncbi:MAG: AMP-binding protein, partial [bacterium]|nr:AMP-binding protein [bacterium]